MVNCPVGCAFLLTIERDRILIALASTPRQAFARLAVALHLINPWSQGFSRNMKAALSQGPRLAGLASELVGHPGSSWWTAPMDRSRQIMMVNATQEDNKASPKWESYAERPVGWRITSTVEDESACLDTIIESGNDWSIGEWRKCTCEIDKSARVFEVVGPADWHSLCAAHPRPNEHRDSPAGLETLTPDWGRVASEWDGVHLTFMALLTVPYVRYRSEAGTTMMWSWDTEGTIWLPGESLRPGAPLPSLGYDVDRFQTVEFLQI